MKTEKVFNYKNSYLQLNINQCGLGISFSKTGVTIIVLIFFIGFYKK